MFADRKCVGTSTYHDMIRFSCRYREILHDVRPRDRVCWMGDKSVHWLSAMMAVWSKGAVFVPLQKGNDELNNHIIGTTRPKAVLTPSASCQDMVRTCEWDDQEGDGVAMVLFTSGSTSLPKGVVLTHDNIMSNLEQIQERVNGDVSPSDSSYSILPWHHCYGLVCELLFLCKNGARIHIPQSNDPREIMEGMKWCSPTLFYAVPKVVETLLRKDKKLPSFVKRNFVFGKNIRRMSLGGAPCHPRLLHFMQDSYGVVALQGYGMTETSPMISLNSIDLNRIGSVGKPLEGVRVRISDNNGEICVRGKNVMAGYWDRVEEDGTILVYPQGEWLHTGDKGRIDDDGFLHVLGRTKTEYKLSNGKYVNPVYLESLLCMHPSIDQAVVFGDGMPHNKVILHMTNKKDADHGLRLVREVLEGKVQPYEIPDEVLMVEEPFSLQNGQLTQKLEPNRRRILEVYASS